jgi:hypothetical protein
MQFNVLALGLLCAAAGSAHAQSAPPPRSRELITQDHVDLLAADSGSVLTSVSMPIAREVMFGLTPKPRLAGQTRDARHDTN